MCKADLNMDLAPGHMFLFLLYLIGSEQLRLPPADKLAPSRFPMACELRMFFTFLNGWETTRDISF